MEGLTKDAELFLKKLNTLNKQGIKAVNVDFYSTQLFPNGFSAERYNEVVPLLVKNGLISVVYDSPRDGPVISLINNQINIE